MATCFLYWLCIHPDQKYLIRYIIRNYNSIENIFNFTNTLISINDL